MECQGCGSDRILSVDAKCNDMCTTTFKGVEIQDYVPNGIPFGGGDYVEFKVCLECGQTQGEFPSKDPPFYFEHKDESCDEAAKTEIDEDYWLCKKCQLSFLYDELDEDMLCYRCKQ